MNADLNIGALSRRTGVPAETLRAWERRYGVPTPRRTASGRRTYSESDLALVVRMRQLVAEGVAPSLAARQLLRDDAPDRPDARQARRVARGYAEQFVTACAEYDEAAADRLLTDALLVYPVEQVCRDVIGPALERIGQLWWQEELPVAAEHIASSLVRDRLAVLSRSYANKDAARLAVLACAPGEMHEIGPAMLGLFLRRRGWRVLSLGQNTPIRDVERVATALRPAVVVISATQLPAARQAVDLCSRLAPRLAERQTIIALGGQGFTQVSLASAQSWGVLLPLGAGEAAEALDQALDALRP